MVKRGLEFTLKLTEPLQSCCCPVQKYLPRMAELAWQLSRYLWRGSVNFKIISRPLFTVIFKFKNDNFKTRDFSPLIERVLAGLKTVGRLVRKKNNLVFCRKDSPWQKKWLFVFWENLQRVNLLMVLSHLYQQYFSLQFLSIGIEDKKNGRSHFQIKTLNCKDDLFCLFKKRRIILHSVWLQLFNLIIRKINSFTIKNL